MEKQEEKDGGGVSREVNVGARCVGEPERQRSALVPESFLLSLVPSGLWLDVHN